MIGECRRVANILWAAWSMHARRVCLPVCLSCPLLALSHARQLTALQRLLLLLLLLPPHSPPISPLRRHCR